MAKQTTNRQIEYTITRAPIRAKIDRDNMMGWRMLARLWNRFDGSAETLAQHIERQHPYCLATFVGNHRHADKWLALHGVALDFDKLAPAQLQTLLNDPFISQYATIAHTSPSHTDSKPRIRIIFLLDKKIVDRDKACLLLKAIHARFPQSDQSCAEVARFFYGIGLGGWVREFGRTLDAATVDQLIANYVADNVKIDHTPLQTFQTLTPTVDDKRVVRWIDAAFERTYTTVASASEGQRWDKTRRAASYLHGLRASSWASDHIDLNRIETTIRAAWAMNRVHGEGLCEKELEVILRGLRNATINPTKEPKWREPVDNLAVKSTKHTCAELDDNKKYQHRTCPACHRERTIREAMKCREEKSRGLRWWLQTTRESANKLLALWRQWRRRRSLSVVYCQYPQADGSVIIVHNVRASAHLGHRLATQFYDLMTWFADVVRTPYRQRLGASAMFGGRFTGTQGNGLDRYNEYQQHLYNLAELDKLVRSFFSGATSPPNNILPSVQVVTEEKATNNHDIWTCRCDSCAAEMGRVLEAEHAAYANDVM